MVEKLLNHIGGPKTSAPRLPTHLALALASLNQVADVLEGMESGQRPMCAKEYQAAAQLGLDILTTHGEYKEVGALVLRRPSLGELAENLFSG